MAVPDVQAEVQIGGAWVDMTDRVYREGGLTNARGRRAEGSAVDPGSSSMTFKNDDGALSNRNPTSPYHGLLGRNTPLRMSVGGADTVLDIPVSTAGRATTPDVAALDITGDLDVRVDVQPQRWSGGLSPAAWEVMGKYTLTGDQRSWLVLVTDTGLIEARWSTDGTAAGAITVRSTIPVPFGPGQRGAVRFTLDVNNGSGGYTARLYTAPTIAGPWVELGTPTITTGGTTNIFNSTAAVEVGDIESMGFDRAVGRRYYAVEVRSGINGSVVANPSFATQAAGGTLFTDGAGRAWTLTSPATLTNRRNRLVHEIPEWSPRWHVSGQKVTVPVQGAGLLRRFNQGEKAFESALRRRIPRAPGIVAYWPLEEGRTATSASSPIQGVLPLVVHGFEFAEDDTCPGSDHLPKLVPDASMSGIVPAHVATGQWLVSFVYYMEALPADFVTFLEITTTGRARRIRITVGPSNIQVRAWNPNDTEILNDSTPATGLTGPNWMRFDLNAEPVGADLRIHLGWVTVAGGGYQLNNLLAGAAAAGGRVTRIQTGYGPALSDLRIGHLSVWTAANPAVIASSDSGYNEERSANRIARLASEESQPILVAGWPGSTEPMGPQRMSTFLDLLAECEGADGGILYEDRERLGLVYRTRENLYNQTPKAVISYGQLAPPLEPVDDDRQVRNDRTVQRQDGSSARVQRLDGPLSVSRVGVYDDSTTLNLAYDEQVPDLAGWLTHLGTWDEARYPQVRIYLHEVPELIQAVTDLDVGDILRITDLPPWLPPGPLDLMVEGYEEEFGLLTWTITFACSPAGKWNLGVLDEAPVVRLAATSGSVIARAASSSNTSLVVATTQTEGGRAWWTEDPAHFPFDADVAGEVVTVADIEPAFRDLFTRTVSSGWGTSTSGHVWSTSGGSASDRSVASNRGIVTLAASPVTLRIQTLPEAVSGDVEVRFNCAVSQAATGNSLVPCLLLRHTGASTQYRFRIHFTTTGDVHLSVANGSTQIGLTDDSGLDYVANNVFQCRVRLAGHRLLGRIWPNGSSEPGGWQIDRTIDTDTIDAGEIGFGASAFTSNSNVSPELRFDDFVVQTPQRFTGLTRSVNGIVKSQAAGGAVQVLHPMIVAL